MANAAPKAGGNKTQRALLLLEYLATSPTAPTHGELGRALGIHRSTLSDLLADLRQAGYVDVVDRRYVLGSRMLALVYSVASHGDAHAGVRPTLQQLAAATGETAVYVIEIGGSGGGPRGVVAVEQVESSNPIRYAAPLGVPFPHHRAAGGLVFLAFGGRSAAEFAATAGEDAEIDVEALERELERVRARGYAVQVPEAPMRAISAPVRAADGRVTGVLTVLGPPGRFDDPERVWPLLEAAAATLGRRHGHGVAGRESAHEEPSRALS